jgi:hypothetical protein
LRALLVLPAQQVATALMALLGQQAQQVQQV